jgi:GAF domain-containing protein
MIDQQIPTGQNDEQTYLELLKIFDTLFDIADHPLTILSNTAAVLKQSFVKISWVGFYFYNGRELYLGPFQGKPACHRIQIGKGVCGTAASQKKTIIVPDVHSFEGHIACDSGSNSEIVIPLISEQGLIGVLDIDSFAFNAFDEIDKKYLEIICKKLVNLISVIEDTGLWVRSELLNDSRGN